jgi:hypothetical protein
VYGDDGRNEFEDVDGSTATEVGWQEVLPCVALCGVSSDAPFASVRVCCGRGRGNADVVNADAGVGKVVEKEQPELEVLDLPGE